MIIRSATERPPFASARCILEKVAEIFGSVPVRDIFVIAMLIDDERAEAAVDMQALAVVRGIGPARAANRDDMAVGARRPRRRDR